jgi:hypothetical protein
MFKKFSYDSNKKEHTLSQIFIELKDLKISNYFIHLQLYTYNDLIRQRLMKILRWFGPFKRLILEFFLGRLIFIQGYLHSNEGESMCVNVTDTDLHDGVWKLNLKGVLPPATRRTIRQVCYKILKSTFCFGAFPLIPFVYFGKPGEGNHIGSVFPMKTLPKNFETDILGRISSLQRVHIVDASVLPELSATTITFTSMANAYRIGTATVQLDQK